MWTENILSVYATGLVWTEDVLCVFKFIRISVDGTVCTETIVLKAVVRDVHEYLAMFSWLNGALIASKMDILSIRQGSVI